MAADPLRVLTSATRHPFGAIDYPVVPVKPRASAITSVLDGGLSPAEARDRVAIAAEWIDVVKLGWATARLTPAADSACSSASSGSRQPSFFSRVTRSWETAAASAPSTKTQADASCDEARPRITDMGREF